MFRWFLLRTKKPVEFIFLGVNFQAKEQAVHWVPQTTTDRRALAARRTMGTGIPSNGWMRSDIFSSGEAAIRTRSRKQHFKVTPALSPRKSSWFAPKPGGKLWDLGRNGEFFCSLVSFVYIFDVPALLVQNTLASCFDASICIGMGLDLRTFMPSILLLPNFSPSECSPINWSIKGRFWKCEHPHRHAFPHSLFILAWNSLPICIYILDICIYIQGKFNFLFFLSIHFQFIALHFSDSHSHIFSTDVRPHFLWNHSRESCSLSIAHSFVKRRHVFWDAPFLCHQSLSQVRFKLCIFLKYAAEFFCWTNLYRWLFWRVAPQKDGCGHFLDDPGILQQLHRRGENWFY